MAENSKPKTLGEFFSSLAIPSEERVRLADLATKRGISGEIIRAYAAKTRAYKDVFQKKERIPGFRSGTPAFDKQAVPRIIRYLGNEKDSRYNFFWEMYRSAAMKYINVEMPELRKLMLESALPANSIEPTEALRLACEGSAKYGASRGDLKKFYSMWWIPRIDDEETVFELCLLDDKEQEKERRIAKLFADVETLKVGEADILEMLAGEADNTSDQTKIDEKRIAAIEASLENLTAKIDELTESVRLELEQRDKSVEDCNSKFAKRLKAVEHAAQEAPTLKDIKSELKKSIDTSKRDADASKDLLDRANEVFSAALQKSLDEEFRPELQKLEAKISSASQAFSIKKESLKQTSNSSSPPVRYRSPLVSLPNFSKPVYGISNELNFANIWIDILLRTQNLSVTFEQALVYSSLFLRNDVVIAESGLVHSWLDCMGWRQYTMNLVASPTWSGEEDWAQGAEHLFVRASERTPRILTINNFDAGLADCYLAPSLLLWKMRGDVNGLAKLFLIPSQENEVRCHQVLEHSAYISEADYESERHLKLRPDCRQPRIERNHLITGVDPEIAAKWIQSSPSIDYELKAIQGALGTQISRHVTTNFKRAAAAIARHLSEPEAIGAALCHHVLPWVRARHGDSAYSELGELIKQLPDMRY